MKILVIHEVNYLTKIVYEYQILPEVLSMLGHDITIVDYDETWESAPSSRVIDLNTRVYKDTHRAYPEACVTVRRPGMIRAPVISRVSGAITASFEIARVLRECDIDVVLLYAVPTMGLQSVLAAYHYRIPIVFRSIDILNKLIPHPVLPSITKLLEHFVYNRVNGVVALTPRLKTHIESYGVPPSRIRLLPCGVDTTSFSPGPRNVELLAEWGIKRDDVVLLFMGTIYRFSGLDQAIRDLPQLKRQNRNVKILIVGHGEDEARLKQLAIDSGVATDVVFTGLQPYSLLPEFIRSADICINPFELNGITQDILPNKLFQYLACGKPLVATLLPGTLPFLCGESHGVVYTALGDFGPCVMELIDDVPRRTSLGHAGRDVTVANYDWKRIAERMIDCIRELS
jgi:glycosyltransferase involved in cell wall biosynthesis